MSKNCNKCKSGKNCKSCDFFIEDLKLFVSVVQSGKPVKIPAGYCKNNKINIDITTIGSICNEKSFKPEHISRFKVFRKKTGWKKKKINGVSRFI